MEKRLGVIAGIKMIWDLIFRDENGDDAHSPTLKAAAPSPRVVKYKYLRRTRANTK